MLDFARLQTPPEHGDVLVEPPPPALRAMAAANRDRLAAYRFSILDTNVQELRSLMSRALIGDLEGPVIAVGHQPEFIHAGVWAKHVVAIRLADAIGGTALNIIVDSDVSKSGVLVVPEVSGDLVNEQTVSFTDIRPGEAIESFPKLDELKCEKVQNTIRDLLGERYDASMLPAYFAGLTEAADASDWVDQTVFARQAVDREFGVSMREHRISRVWPGPMLADMMLNAHRFAWCYNQALADYRQAHGIRGANRPIPDLVREDSLIELPVWVYRLGELRRRLFVQPAPDKLLLCADANPFGEISLKDLTKWERAQAALEDQAGYVFRPRALAVTLWARVLAADLFIHGIGGAKYDRITDGLIRRYWGVEPPGFACVSATLWMNLPGWTQDSGQFLRALAKLRDVRYNPQRHVQRTEGLAALLDRRADAVAESIALRNRTPRDRLRRRTVFERIRSVSQGIVDRSPQVIHRAQQAVEEARIRHRADRLARHREYFFAMLDRQALELLLNHLPDVAAFRV